MQQGLPAGEAYVPAEDTFFIADYVGDMRGRRALDIGSGSGYLTALLSKNFEYVVGTDINFGALGSQTYRTTNLVCCNGADALNMTFDLVVCNMPYLATDAILDVATDGGADGVEVPMRIMDSAGRQRRGGRQVRVRDIVAVRVRQAGRACAEPGAGCEGGCQKKAVL